MSRATTHEWVCGSCGVRLQGRRVVDGSIRPTNAAPSGKVKPCTCLPCREAES
jgi:hypothetical protein